MRSLVPLARLLGWALFVARVGVYDTIELLRGHAFHDYATFHAAACALRTGVNPYRTSELQAAAAACKLPGVHPYFYPPLFAETMVPMTFIAPWTARLLFHAISLACIFGSAFVIDRWLRERERGDELRAAFAIVLASFWPIRDTQLMGQVNSIVLLLLAVWWTRRDRSPRAAIALGFAAAIKMSPALLLLVPLRERRFRELAWGAGTSAALILASCLAIGSRGVEFLLGVLGGFVPGGRWHGLKLPLDIFGNHSLAGLLSRLSPSEDPLRLSRGMAIVQGLTLALMVTLWLLRAMRVHEHARAAALIVVMVIAPSFTWEHHLTFALLAIAMLIAAAPASSLAYAIAACAAVALMSDRLDYYVLPPAKYSRVVSAIARSPKLPSLLALFAVSLFAGVAGLRTAKRDEATGTSPTPTS